MQNIDNEWHKTIRKISRAYEEARGETELEWFCDNVASILSDFKVWLDEYLSTQAEQNSVRPLSSQGWRNKKCKNI